MVVVPENGLARCREEKVAHSWPLLLTEPVSFLHGIEIAQTSAHS
jgi:hypothetical protein